MNTKQKNPSRHSQDYEYEIERQTDLMAQNSDHLLLKFCKYGYPFDGQSAECFRGNSQSVYAQATKVGFSRAMSSVVICVKALSKMLVERIQEKAEEHKTGSDTEALQYLSDLEAIVSAICMSANKLMNLFSKSGPPEEKISIEVFNDTSLHILFFEIEFCFRLPTSIIVSHLAAFIDALYIRTHVE